MSDPQSPGDQPRAEGCPTLATAKLAVRDQLLAARRQLTLTEIAGRASQLAKQVLTTEEVRRAASVAAYASVGTEPGTGMLLDGLRALGKRVILPVLQPSNDLDWAVYDGALISARRGLLEPPGPRLGPAAVSSADLVLVPGLAVSSSGERLGRGGGSYDRTLARVPHGTPVWVLLYASEIGLDVPVEVHDRSVTGAATAEGITRFR